MTSCDVHFTWPRTPWWSCDNLHKLGMAESSSLGAPQRDDVYQPNSARVPSITRVKKEPTTHRGPEHGLQARWHEGNHGWLTVNPHYSSNQLAGRAWRGSLQPEDRRWAKYRHHGHQGRSTPFFCLHWSLRCHGVWLSLTRQRRERGWFFFFLFVSDWHFGWHENDDDCCWGNNHGRWWCGSHFEHNVAFL